MYKKDTKIATGIPIITIDGPSGAGKGTLCKMMAKELQWNLLDSGAIYRVLALSALRYHTNVSSEDELLPLALNLNVHFVLINDNFEVISRGKDVSSEIRIQKIADIASKIAVFPKVRKALLHRQRSFLKAPGLIADGRDMGTIVFPEASVKIFLDATPEERAHRRMIQLQKKGFSVNLARLLSEIKNRDEQDRERTVSPLIPAGDALVLNSTNLTIEQVFEKGLQYVHQHLTLS